MSDAFGLGPALESALADWYADNEPDTGGHAGLVERIIAVVEKNSRTRNDREFSDVRGERDVRSIGPFKQWPVTVNGWTVDLLQALYRDETTVELVLDNRLCIDLHPDIAGQVIEFVADAIAVARGWSCHPRTPEWTIENDVPPIRSLPWHQMHGITSVERDEVEDDS